VIYRPQVFEDRLTRGGPVVRRPASTFLALNISTDSRKAVVLNTNPSQGCSEEGACSRFINLDVTFHPASNVAISIGPAFDHSESRAQYVTAVDDPTATAFYGRRYVFADLTQKTVSMDTRLNITFTPTLTLEVFAQPLLVSGRFANYKEFVAPRVLDKRVYDAVSEAGAVITVDPDGSGRLAAQLRQARLPPLARSVRAQMGVSAGSTLFFVWTQNRSSDGLGDLQFGRDVDTVRGTG
jgi:hypothetical protein